MRTPRRHDADDGSVTYRVRFRLRGQQTSETFRGPDAERQATAFCKVLDALGASAARAWLDQQDTAEAQLALTLDEWAPRYIDSLTNVTDGTRDRYRRMYDGEWSRHLGALPLVSIDREAVARAVNNLSARRSDKTVRNYHGLLSAMLRVAVGDGHIPSNPCENVALPERTSHEKAEMRLIEKDEFSDLYANVPAHYQPFVAMLAGTGMRFSEALALDVGDVSDRNHTVRITKAIKWNGGRAGRQIGPPKTPESRRTVDLGGLLMGILEPLLDRPRTDPLFLTVTGRHISHSRFWHDVWSPAITAAGLDPRPRIHDVRHSHASWLIADGVPLLVVSRRLGHKSIQVTADIYGHLSPDIRRASALAADAAFDGLRLGGDTPTALPASGHADDADA